MVTSEKREKVAPRRLDEANVRGRDRAERLADDEAAAVVEVVPIVAGRGIRIAAGVGGRGIELKRSAAREAYAVAG